MSDDTPKEHILQFFTYQRLPETTQGVSKQFCELAQWMIFELPDNPSNRSTVRRFEFGGVTDTIAGWSRRTGIPYLKLRRRITDGWSFARAIEACEIQMREP